ncbi:CBS domain-containing protein, partial [Schlesneria sp.]|uniref:CBS domain-containing protein n=1 Tax=Schlesneria sp. TaxID=2762018 RepID=UPI002F0EC2E4
EQEASMVTMKTTLGGIPVKRAMMTEFHSLHPEETLQRAIELILATPQTDFPVMQDSQVVGILPSRDLMIALQQYGPDKQVGEVMRRDFLSVDSNEMLDLAFSRIRQAECCSTAPVMNRNHLVGLLTAENVNEFLQIVSAIGKKQTRSP